MLNCVGIRRETKDKTQHRTPLTPKHVHELIKKHNISVLVEPWEQRIFKDHEYKKAGATLTSDLTKCNIIFGIKEIVPELMLPERAYCFFSHTIKGQAYNMPMLKHLIQIKNTLFDYELVKEKTGKRIIFFGDFAGYAGMIDSLWAFGQRMKAEGIKNPFSRIKYASEYSSLAEAEEAIRTVGAALWKDGLPNRIVPFVCGFTGGGKVAGAAKHLFDKLPVVEIQPKDLSTFYAAGRFSNKVVYKVHFQKEDMFRHSKSTHPFNQEEFRQKPTTYTSQFERYVPMLSMLINGIYWEPPFPRLISKRFMRALYLKERKPRLKVIGDITCDIGGSIELTAKETDSTNPVYVHEPLTGRVRDGFDGRGPVILAVDKLPTELPKEASESFGNALLPFVPMLARAKFNGPFNQLVLPDEFREAMIVHRGKLRPRFKHLQRLFP